MSLRMSLAMLFAATTLLLSGCSSSGKQSLRFYVLNPVAQEIVIKAAPASPLTVEVYSLRLPQYLERPQIVTRSDANQLVLAEYHQWGGNLRKNMSRVLAKNLATLLATPNVYIAPHLSATPADVRVELEVMQFERMADGQVQLSVQWRLLDGDSGKPRLTQMTDLSSPAPLAANDYDGTVTAMSQLFAELSRVIATEIQHRY